MAWLMIYIWECGKNSKGTKMKLHIKLNGGN